MGSRLEAKSTAVRKKIEKHTFDNEEGEEYESSKFGGFTDYFRRKKIKLQNVDAELRSSSTDNPPIFRGVVVHVNGYTQPSLNDLHTLIVSHGGGFVQYLDSKTMVTHIIASNLTLKKKVEFVKYRMVKPAWVVDSIQAGRLLPWDSYRVVDEGPGQHVLAFNNGRVVSQASTQRDGYRDQTNTSWCTDQMKDVASRLNEEIPKSSLRVQCHRRMSLPSKITTCFVMLLGWSLLLLAAINFRSAYHQPSCTLRGHIDRADHHRLPNPTNQLAKLQTLMQCLVRSQRLN